MPLRHAFSATEDEVKALIKAYQLDPNFTYWGGNGVFCDRGYELTGHTWISQSRSELVTIQLKRRAGALPGIDRVAVQLFVDPLGSAKVA